MMVWAPMLRVLADLLDVELDEITTTVERRPLERTIEVPAWARSRRARTARSASRCGGIVDGRPLLVVEHVTRIDDDCAPEWPRSTSPGGEHRVVISGHPHLEVTVHGTGAGRARRGGRRQRHRGQPHRQRDPGGVCGAARGRSGPLDLPPITGAAQLVR